MEYPAAIEVITKADFAPKKEEGKKKTKKEKGEKQEKVEEVVVVVQETYKLPKKLGEEFRVKEEITVFRQEDIDKEEEEKRNAAMIDKEKKL